MERILRVVSHAEEVPIHGSTNGHSANGHSTNGHAVNAVSAPHDSRRNSEAEIDPNASPCGPELSVYDPEDLQAMDCAVRLHVGNADQSDDLTIVYLSAK